MSNLSEEDIEAINIVGQVLPFKANNYVVEQLIDIVSRLREMSPLYENVKGGE